MWVDPHPRHIIVNQIARVLACASLLALLAWRSETATLAPGARTGWPHPKPSDASLPVLGDCNTVPNYSTSTALRGCLGASRAPRWESFPITYSVDTSSLPASVRKLYDEAGVVARDLWSDRDCRARGSAPTSGERRTDQRAIRSVRVNPVGRVHDDRRQWQRDYQRFDSMARFPDDVSLIKRGLQRRVTLHTVNTLAHEIGHALGIQLHSPDASDLMNEDGNFLPGRDDARDPRSFITAADRNTMLHAYLPLTLQAVAVTRAIRRSATAMRGSARFPRQTSTCSHELRRCDLLGADRRSLRPSFLARHQPAWIDSRAVARPWPRGGQGPDRHNIWELVVHAAVLEVRRAPTADRRETRLVPARRQQLLARGRRPERRRSGAPTSHLLAEQHRQLRAAVGGISAVAACRGARRAARSPTPRSSAAPRRTTCITPVRFSCSSGWPTCEWRRRRVRGRGTDVIR